MGGVKRKSDENGSKQRKKYSWLTFTQKIEVIDKLKSGKTKAEVSREYGTSESTIGRIWQQREATLSQVSASASCTLNKSSKIRPATMIRMEKLLLIWINDCVSKRIPLSRGLIMSRADTIHDCITKPSPLLQYDTKASNVSSDATNPRLKTDSGSDTHSRLKTDSGSETHSRLNTDSGSDTNSRLNTESGHDENSKNFQNDINSSDFGDSNDDISPTKKFKASRG